MFTAIARPATALIRVSLERLELVLNMIKTIEVERDAIATAGKSSTHANAKKIQDLTRLKSIGPIGTILPSRPARRPCRRAQRRSRMARLRATASAARSVLDGCEHDGMLSRVGS
jgi:hypothetical protein